MNAERWIFAILVSIQGTLAGLESQGVLPAKYAGWAGVIATIIAGILRVMPSPAPAAAALPQPPDPPKA